MCAACPAPASSRALRLHRHPARQRARWTWSPSSPPPSSTRSCWWTPRWAGTTRTTPSCPSDGSQAGTRARGCPTFRALPLRRRAGAQPQRGARLPQHQRVRAIPIRPSATLCERAGEHGGHALPGHRVHHGRPGHHHVQSWIAIQGKVMGTYLFNALRPPRRQGGLRRGAAELLQQPRAHRPAPTGSECTDGSCFFSLNQYGYLEGAGPAGLPGARRAPPSPSPWAASCRTAGTSLDRSPLNAGLRYDAQTMYRPGQPGGPRACPTSGRPRVGVIYDFTQQGRSKLFVNYARFYESVPLDMVDLLVPAAAARCPPRTSAPACNPRDPESPCRRLRQRREPHAHRQPRRAPTSSGPPEGGDTRPGGPEHQAAVHRRVRGGRRVRGAACGRFGPLVHPALRSTTSSRT